MVEILGVEFGTVHLSAVAASLFLTLLAIIKWRATARKMDSLLKIVNEADSEKAQMYNRLRDLEAENKRLNTNLTNIENEYRERVQALEEGEKRIRIESKKLEEEFLKIKGVKEALELHRSKVGSLEMEKGELQRKLKDAMATYEEEFASERRKLESQLREVKERTKEVVDELSREKDAEIKKLKDENQQLKGMVEKLRERLSLWEAVGDL